MTDPFSFDVNEDGLREYHPRYGDPIYADRFGIVLYDMFGTRVRVGDTVVFPTRAGSFLGLKGGEVVELKMVPRSSWTSEDDLVIGISVQVTSYSSKYGRNQTSRPSKPDPQRVVVVNHTFAHQIEELLP